MPRTKKNNAALDAGLPEIPYDARPTYDRSNHVESVDAVMRKFKKAILERALGAQMTHHLGYVPGDEKTDRNCEPPQWQQRQDAAHRRGAVAH